MRFGLTLSSEEQSPLRLVELAGLAEEAGFDFVSISDHFHPWVEAQGHSSFVWSVLGAIAATTRDIEVAVGVTCPTVRIHPVVLAQATATTSRLLEGRFVWGVGTGEALNEHVTGEGWPPHPVRLEMLEEAVSVVRALWTGESITHYGKHYTVEDARVFDAPTEPVPVIVSAFGSDTARSAAAIGDGLWITGAAEGTIDTFRDAGGDGPVYSQLTVCWGEDQTKAEELAHELWAFSSLPGQLAQDLRTVSDFEEAVGLVRREDVASSVPCGPDPEPMAAAAREAVDAGVDHLYFHQIGPDQEGFLELWVDQLSDLLVQS